MRFGFLALIALASVVNGLVAGSDTMVVPQELQVQSSAEKALRADSISVLATTGILPEEPFVSSPRAYTLIPIEAGVLWTLDDVGNDDVAWGAFRGNTSFRFTAYYHDVIHGPESRFTGPLAGPQYNFIQPGWNLVPFIGAQVGVGFCDSGNSGHLPYQQGQDFCFTFTVNAGARYCFDQHWSLIGEIVYEHFSNGGLSEPQRQNYGLDLFGPQISLAYTF